MTAPDQSGNDLFFQINQLDAMSTTEDVRNVLFELLYRIEDLEKACATDTETEK